MSSSKSSKSKGEPKTSSASSVRTASDGKPKPKVAALAAVATSRAGKGNKALDRQKAAEEENLAREKQRLRTTPDEFGITLEDYAELLTCDVGNISRICSRIFGYSARLTDHQSAMLDHFYVRAVHDLREFAADEEGFRRLMDLLLQILSMIKKKPTLDYEVVEMIGRTYAALTEPKPGEQKTHLSDKQIQKLMSFYTETILRNTHLLRHAFTTSPSVVYLAKEIKVHLPNDHLFSVTALMPLAEAIPTGDLKLPSPKQDGQDVPVQYDEKGEPIPASQALHGAKDASTTHPKKPDDKPPQAGADLPKKGPSETDISRAVQKIIQQKLAAFMDEVETAIRKREVVLQAKLLKI